MNVERLSKRVTISEIPGLNPALAGFAVKVERQPRAFADWQLVRVVNFNDTARNLNFEAAMRYAKRVIDGENV